MKKNRNKKEDKNIKTNFFSVTDYRENGRDDSGYRALHYLLNIENVNLEIQVRSKLQHYWSESIERTSIFYGHRLKEGEGDRRVIQYFKTFSNALHEIETREKLSLRTEITMQEQRINAENIIELDSKRKLISAYVNRDIIHAMSGSESSQKNSFNNWILVLDWSDGNFLTWEKVGRDPDEAVKTYLRYENEYTEDKNNEVVMIGTSDISSVQFTHSHYFGIEHHNKALEDMEKSIIGLSRRSKIDVGARKILMKLKEERFWGKRRVNISTLQNHLCRNIAGFQSSLSELRKIKVIKGRENISLDPRKRSLIDSYI